MPHFLRDSYQMFSLVLEKKQEQQKTDSVAAFYCVPARYIVA